MTDVHARIHAFLQQQTATPLHVGGISQPDSFYNKAGLLPFVDGKERRFLVMKPIAKHTHLAPPDFQLCKGTRMQHLPHGWQDIADGQPHQGTPETLCATALREGIEELGITLEAITMLYALGAYPFSSSKSKIPRHMWLFAARFTDENALLPMQSVAETTAERRWMTAVEFAQSGRDDHRAILADIASKLEPHHAAH